MRCHIVPPYLLDRLLQHDDPAVSAVAAQTLQADRLLRSRRSSAASGPTPAAASSPARTISDAAGTTTLPGTVRRTERAAPAGDAAVDEAYDGLGATFALYLEVYGRDSLDGRGLPLDATVHYGRAYDNAFWDGSRMVFGDGDGQVFGRFTKPLTVVGHELTHGVTQFTAGLDYSGQSGALNESVSDVFGSLVEQRALGQTADEASWLIGAGLFTDAVQGVALRSMKAPGTAYDDPQLGKDPQPATMSGYVETSDDNGGVHTNSGIPNHAFYLVAVALGGHAWEGAGQVWYDALTGGAVTGSTDFAGFAAATVAAAQARWPDDSTVADAVRSGWGEVGVDPGSGA